MSEYTALTPNPVADSKPANPVVNDPAAIPALQARIEELVEERDTARRLLGAATQMQTETQAKLEKAEEERDDLGRKLNTARYGQPDFAWSIHEQEMADLRAKLAKAVEALREIASEASVTVHTWKNGINFKKMYERWRAIAVARIDIARKTLAELEGK